MQRILIASSKGGCGKTTLTTNLAVALSRAGRRVWIIDADAQGSSAEWWRARGDADAGIGLLHSVENGHPATSGWSLRIPPNIEFVLVDSPAGLRAHQLSEFLRRCDSLLVPIVPSAMDTRATATFLDELSHEPVVRSGQLRVGLIGNRLKARTIAARQLPLFTDALPFPLLTCLRDSQAYVLAAALGRGLFDYDSASMQPCRDDWAALLEWVRPSLPAEVAHESVPECVPG